MCSVESHNLDVMRLYNIKKYSKLLRLESFNSYESLLFQNRAGRYAFYSKVIDKMGCSLSKTIKIETSDQPTKSRMSSGNDFIEDVVCQDSDIKEKEMKVVDLQDAGKVLLIRQNGKLSALGNKCPHYGAPLVSSALGDGRLRCQWHGACFNIATGDIEDFPGLDSLPCYQVTVEGNNVKVRALKSDLEKNKRIKLMARKVPNNNQHFVVIGGGPSGAVCIETLRQEGFEGRITLIAKENYYPYDRIKINKAMDVEMSVLQLRKPEFYNDFDIEVKKGCEAVSIDSESKKVALSDGSSLNYDVLYIATGSSPRKAPIPGADLKNVIVLREYAHAVYTQSLLSPEKHVVVLGSSFIGMEAAAYVVNKVEKVTVISKDSVPFQAPMGPKVGAGVMKMFEEKGVHFVVNSGMKCCVGDENGAVSSVELVDGTILKADIVIMGVGSTLNTEFLKGSGVITETDGSIEVNEYLQTNIPNIFAGGDIACAPVWSHDNIKASIGHYGLAQYHGRMAAINMLNKKQPLKAVPYFWTMLFGKGIRYSGHGRYDDVMYDGDPLQLNFIAFYLKEDKVVAISSAGRDPIVSKYAEYIYQGNRLTRKDLETNLLGWSE